MIWYEYFLPTLYTLFVWWFSTGAILYLDGLPRRTYPVTVAAWTVVLLLAFWGITGTAESTTVGAAYSSFTCGLLAWGWNELMFLFGYITGPRRSPCPPTARGVYRFMLALGTMLYHEIAILATAAVLVVLSWDKPNQVGLWTFVILWGMRLSAKFNLFLGVRNRSEDFLPHHLDFLKTYFRHNAINLLFPISVSVSTALFTILALHAGAASADPFAAVTACFLATMMGLGVLEHWFLVLPLPAEDLWKWGLRSHQRQEAQAEDPDTAGARGEPASAPPAPRDPVATILGALRRRRADQ